MHIYSLLISIRHLHIDMERVGKPGTEGGLDVERVECWVQRRIPNMQHNTRTYVRYLQVSCTYIQTYINVERNECRVEVESLI